MWRPRPIHAVGGALAVVALVLVPSALQPSRVPCHRDLLDFFLPLKAHYARSLARGDVPWWDPHALGGTPFFATLQSQVLYPPNLLSLAAGPSWGLSLLTALHLWIAGMGAVLLARALGRSLPAAALAGAAFAACGPIVSLQDLHNQLCTIAWAPWAWLAACRWSRERGVRRLAAWTLALVLAFLGGEPHVALLIAASSVVVAAACAQAGERTRVVRGAAAVAAWTLACCLVQLVPFVELVALSDRVGSDFAQAGRHALDPARAAAAWDAPDGPFDAPGGPYLRSLHLGVALVPLAIAGAVARGAASRVLAAIAGVTLALALGPHLPLAGEALVRATPFLRYPIKHLELTALAIALLAAAGLDAVARAAWAGDGRARAVAGWLVAAIVAVELVSAQRRLALALPASVTDPSPALALLAEQTGPDGPRVHPTAITAERIAARAERLARGDVLGAHREKVELLEGSVPTLLGLHATTGGAALTPRSQAALLARTEGGLDPATARALRAGFVVDDARRRLALPLVPVDGGAAALYVLPSAGPWPDRAWVASGEAHGAPGLPAPSDYPGWREGPPGTWRFLPTGLVPAGVASVLAALALLVALARRPPIAPRTAAD